MLYTWNLCNIVNQLYVNKKKKNANVRMLRQRCAAGEWRDMKQSSLDTAKCKPSLFRVVLRPQTVASGWHFWHFLGFIILEILTWASVLFKWFFLSKSRFIQLENHKQGKLKLSRSLIVFSSNLSHLPPPLPPPFFNFSDNLFKHIFPGAYSDYIPYKPRINWSWKFLKATFLWFQQSYSKLWWWAKHPLIHFGEREDIPVLRLVIYCCTTNNFKT